MISGILMFHTNVNADMTKYLPDDSQMKRGLEIVTSEFGSSAQMSGADVHVMFEGMSPKEIPGIRTLLEAYPDVQDKVQEILSQVNELKAANADELEALRIKYLSKKGEITALFNEFRNVAPEEKRELGQLLNQLRQTAEARINELRDQINDKCQISNDKLDLTRTPDPIALGTRHPLSVVSLNAAT